MIYAFVPCHQVLQGADRSLMRGDVGPFCWPRTRLLEPLVVRLADGLASQQTSAIALLQTAGAQLMADGPPPGADIKRTADPDHTGDGETETITGDAQSDQDLFGKSAKKARSAISKVSFAKMAKAAARARVNGRRLPDPTFVESEESAVPQTEVRIALERINERRTPRRSGRLRSGPPRRNMEEDDWDE